MTAAYTTAHLLADVRLRAFTPGDSNVFEDTDILLLADAELQTVVLPLVMSLRADYYVTKKDVSIVAAQEFYDIPVRSVGMQLREVHLVDAGGAITNLPLTEYERLVSTTATGSPEAFYFRGNQIGLAPIPLASTGTLRLWYPLRPSKLVETTSAAAVSSATSTVATCSSVPDTFTTSQTYDFVRQDGASEPRAIDQTCSLIASTDMTFASFPDGFAAGDYIALAGQTPIPQMPAELRPILVAATVVRLCEAMQLPGLDSARKSLEEAVKAVQVLMTPRVVGSPRKVVAPRRWGI